MLGDCHIHMILDGVYYRDAIDHQKNGPDEQLIRQRLSNYAGRGITYLRDGGDAWGVGLRASQLAGEYGITYRTPVSNLCRKGHYGGFLGWEFESLAEYRQLVDRVKEMGGHFIKIMVSGLMDFNTFGAITDTACSYEQCCDLVSVAHDAGFSVMVHANGPEAVSNALRAGVDSIEHGAYLDEETLCQLAESNAVWVPTAVTVGNLIGAGRFPDAVLEPLLEQLLSNVSFAAKRGATIALGTDAGAFRVFHAEAVAQEYALLQQALGDTTETVLRDGVRQISAAF